MKKTIKKLFVIALAVVTLMVFAVSVYAVQPRYTNTNGIELTLSFSSSGANCYCRIRGNASVKNITNGTMKLLDSSGHIVATWTNLSVTGNQLIVSRTATNIVAGETYTLTISAYVNTSTYSERINQSTSATN